MTRKTRKVFTKCSRADVPGSTRSNVFLLIIVLESWAYTTPSAYRLDVFSIATSKVFSLQLERLLGQECHLQAPQNGQEHQVGLHKVQPCQVCRGLGGGFAQGWHAGLCHQTQNHALAVKETKLQKGESNISLPSPLFPPCRVCLSYLQTTQTSRLRWLLCRKWEYMQECLGSRRLVLAGLSH